MHMYTGQERMVNSVRKYFIWCQYLSCKMMNSKTIFRLVSRYQSIVIQPSAAAVVSGTPISAFKPSIIFLISSGNSDPNSVSSASGVACTN